VYSYALVQGCKRDWISPSRLSKLGAAIVGVLSMGKVTHFSHRIRLMIVTGLLLSYRFSSALSRWDEGKKVWVSLRSDIRDGIRMVCALIEGADGSYLCLSRVRNQYPLRHPDQHQVHRLYMSHKISNLIKRVRHHRTSPI
jgi:predicted membrane chloride channel (bestrophin family)